MDHGPAVAALAGYVGHAARAAGLPGAFHDRAGAAPGEADEPGAAAESGRLLGPFAAGKRRGRLAERDATSGAAVSAARPWATAERTMALWCADWPLVAAGVSPYEPAVVLHGGRTVACTPAARAEGVHRGMRRRDAEARCPRLAVLDHDPARDARAFEPVAAAVEAFAPRVELTRSGLCSVATRGPSRYFGGDEPLATRVVTAVREVLGAAAAHVGAGVADGAFAASLAARATAPVARVIQQGGEHVAPVLVLACGETASFLAGLPVSALSVGADDGDEMVELASLLVRLGLRTLGAVAALPETDLVARFGASGGLAWRRSRGLDDRPLEARDPPPDLAAEVVLDPPADRVDAAAFAARTLTADLHDRLDAKGLACTRLTIEALTTDGVCLSRVWRHEGRFSPGATAERVRWQLDGWLATTARSAQEGDGAAPADREGDAPGDVGGRAEGGGLALLRLVPEEVVAGGGRQLGFWGGDAEADERAARALARVQGLLGPAAVVTAVASGGRGPRLRATLVPWGDPREPAQPGGVARPAAIELGPAVDRPEVPERSVRRPKRDPGFERPHRAGITGAAADEVPPWPGRIPGPPPAVVPVEGEPAEVIDAAGDPVTVSGRGMASAAPAWVAWSGGTFEVDGWAGPWPVEERWWDPAAAARLARIQVTASDGTALLLACESGSWWLEATYD